MTRKDFELIAMSIKESTLDIMDFNLRASKMELQEAIDHIANNLSLVLATTNPNFDQDKFLKACKAK